jgi:hypothetical protein
MSGAGRRDADKGNYQPLTPPFWPGHTAVSRRTAGIPPLDTLNERAPALRPDRGLLLGVTHNISQRVLI